MNMVGNTAIPKRAVAPTGRKLNQEQYWKSLERSFNKDFIQAAREKYNKRKRLDGID